MRIDCSLVALGALLAAGSASADRAMTVTAGGVFVTSTHSTNGDFTQRFGVRVTATWEHPPIPPPPEPHHFNSSVSLVPELFTGALGTREHVEGELGAGIRAQLEITERRAQPPYAGTRGVFYFAARGDIIGVDRDPAVEGAFGMRVDWHTLRAGYEIGLRKRDAYQRDQEYPTDLLFSFYGGVAL